MAPCYPSYSVVVKDFRGKKEAVGIQASASSTLKTMVVTTRDCQCTSQTQVGIP